MMLPTSIYIHTPWCIRKCPYCDFNSHKSPDLLPETQYLEALLADIKTDLESWPRSSIHSIFIGGGTPSLLSGQFYQTLLDTLASLFSFEPNIEITLEANPGTVEQSRFRDYRLAGINRISLGVQSFNDNHLKQLGRIHNSHQSSQAIDVARLAGFDNINIDIMNGLPEQTVEEGILDLKSALQFNPEHLSWYQFTIEPNTYFYKHPPKLPSEENCETLEQEGLSLLASNGFIRYEISAFSQPNKPSKHNLNYWQFGDYFGIGAGAHGKLTDPKTHEVIRTRKYRQPHDYLNPIKPFLAEKTSLSPESLIFEFMLNTTRLQEPIPIALFEQTTGLAFSNLRPMIIEAVQKDFIKLNKHDWQVTDLGRRFTNDLQCLFLNVIHE